MGNETHQGKLKTYDPVKGYGFITREIGKDVFVYFDDFAGVDGDSGAIVGSFVQFNIVDSPKGPRAKNVRIVS